MAPQQRTIRANRLFNIVLKLTLGVWLRLRFNVRIRNRKLVEKLKAPYLLLPNHVGYWDPFILGSIVPHPVCFLAADANFRSRRLAALLGLVGTIPKSKGISDLEAIRQMMRIRDRGDVICLFAEGERTWDGGPLPMIPATAKLARLLAVPVVTPIFHGGHLSHPRWARFARRGRIVVDFRLAIGAEEIGRLSLGDITARIAPAIAHDDLEEQKHLRVAYRGRRRAEGLEHVLHACPRCGAIATMRAAGNVVRCTRCRMRIRYDRYGFLAPVAATGREKAARTTVDPDIPQRAFGTPKSVRDWSRLQQPLVSAWVAQSRLRPDTTLLTADPVRAGVGYRSRKLSPLPEGSLRLFPDRLQFDHTTDMRSFNLRKIEGLNVQHRSHLEFYYRGSLYSLQPRDHRVPIHLWRIAIELLRKTPDNKDSETGVLPETELPGIVRCSYE